jgi:hypothetical protein
VGAIGNDSIGGFGHMNAFDAAAAAAAFRVPTKFASERIFRTLPVKVEQIPEINRALVTVV